MSDEHLTDYEDVSHFGLDPDDEETMHAQQRELTFCWTTRDGSPMASIMSYLRRDGTFWLTSSARRKRIAALRRDPRVAVVVTSTGTEMGGDRTVTYKGTARIHEDRTTKDWFYPALARRLVGPNPKHVAEFVGLLDSPGRVVIEVRTGLRVGYDGTKMAAATAQSRAAGALRNRRTHPEE